MRSIIAESLHGYSCFLSFLTSQSNTLYKVICWFFNNNIFVLFLFIIFYFIIITFLIFYVV